MNDKRRLRSLDLNLLVVFEAVYRERHVTRAAEKLGMSQPAMSNALQRLRSTLGDELLVKSPAGMEPTERAVELAVPIQGILAELEDLLANRRFDPATAKGTITIAAVDYFNVILLPPLMQVLSDQAPGVSLRITPTNGRSYELLDVSEADLALASFGDVPVRFQKDVLRNEGYACVLRRDHPALLSNGLTPKRYAELRHILHSPGKDTRGSTDQALAVLGKQRHVALTVSSFIHAESILTVTDMILTAPRSVAARLAENPALTTIPCPVAVDANVQQLEMLSHTRLGKRPLVAWVRQVLLEIAAVDPQ
ncbi:DNA-binding transcriptional regulator, LysR family [Aliiroseovarius halocynthiae]|nr:LysR family transcriptional regulator [Aliiroseovarius halocynthiae]SMR81487.1 DNA-binding transcriptional regulator, LysR family [Aliiroseovarius halocynthiae]